jgi:toxin ParE1/3/4
VKVYWTDSALADLDAIFGHISQDSPHNALRGVDRITARSKLLGQFPRVGRQIRDQDNASFREIFEGRYRIAYLITSSGIEIVTVIHTARTAD